MSKIISIHAPTRGATSRRFHPSKKRNYFNPRSHEGSDKAISCKNKRKCKISIHAPTRGATDINLSGIVATEISIHAPTRGATIVYIVNCDGYIDFNPRSHEGSDSEDRINIYQVNISIHAPTRGATPVSTPIPGIHCIFQSTLPRGERRITGACWKQST